MGRYALLVATGEYADPQLGRLRAPDQDVNRLAAILEDPQVGAFDEVHVLRDATDSEVRAAVEDALSDRTGADLVLVYFSCHGIVNPQGRLYFATANTRLERPAGTAVPRSFLNEQLEDCHAGGRVLLLDCCFSGAFGDGFKAAPTSALAGRVGEGYVVIAASDAFEYAYEADTLTLEAPRASIFTDVMLEALTTGAADSNGDGWISVDELFGYVQDGVSRRRPEQKPKLFAHQAEPNLIYLARVPTAPINAVSDRRSATPSRPVTYTQSHLVVARGIKAIAEPIARTLGPLGFNVLVRDDHGKYFEARDTASIVDTFRPEDARDELGVSYVRDLVGEVHRKAGDGAATATVLAHAMTTGALEELRAGANPMALKRGLEEAREILLTQLAHMAFELETKEQLSSVVTLYAGNEMTGPLVAEALDKVGKEGVITVEESNTLGVELELTEGTRFDKGFISGYFVTDLDRQEAVLEDPYILLYDSKISAVKDLLPLLEKVMETHKPLLIIAEDVEGEALATLVVNKVRDTFKSVAVKAPGFGDSRRAMLQDMAIVTGGHVLGGVSRTPLENADISMLGMARKVVVTKDETTIVEGAGDAEQINGRVNQIRAEIETSDSDYDREKLQERLAKVAGGVAVIKVGAATEAEINERKNHFERAVRVARVLVYEGMVPGGGATLIALRRYLQALPSQQVMNNAAQILVTALASPAMQIVRNAGHNIDDHLDVLQRQRPDAVFDATTGEFVDGPTSHIIDPAAVLRIALTSAVALTNRFLTIS